jgi:hypothetical protein
MAQWSGQSDDDREEKRIFHPPHRMLLQKIILSCLRRRFLCRIMIKSQVEQKHGHPGLSKDSELSAAGVFGHKPAYHIFAELASTRHPPYLQGRVLRADVRVQAASRSRHSVNWNLRVGRQAIALAVFLGQFSHPGERFIHVGCGGIVLRPLQELGAGRRKIGAS